VFSLSDIKNIVIPCDQEQCSGEVRLPPSDDFDANRPMQCPVCHKEGFIGTFRAIRRIVRLSKEEWLEPMHDDGGPSAKNLLRQVKIEVTEAG
jgi:hypothetical protein